MTGEEGEALYFMWLIDSWECTPTHTKGHPTETKMSVKEAVERLVNIWHIRKRKAP